MNGGVRPQILYKVPMDIESLLDENNKMPAEETFDRFVKSYGGQKISDSLPGDPTFQNADYLFPKEKVIAELKTLQSDFGVKDSFRKKQIDLAKAYLAQGKMPLSAIFNSRDQPADYVKDLLRLFRPALSRILKKANTQLKVTKRELNLNNSSGILLMINDDFFSLEPRFIVSIVCEILAHSYSSVDAFVYLTLNQYADIPDNNYANLLWIPSYSERAPDSLPDFINSLGGQWFQFLESETGKFDNKIVTDDPTAVTRAKSIPRITKDNS